MTLLTVLAVATYAWIAWQIFKARGQAPELDNAECVVGALCWPLLVVMAPFCLVGEAASRWIDRYRGR